MRQFDAILSVHSLDELVTRGTQDIAHDHAVVLLIFNNENLFGHALSPRELPPPYSITSSARASRACGTVRPSAFAVLFMTRSNLVGCSTGGSAGLAPLRMMWMWPAGSSRLMKL